MCEWPGANQARAPPELHVMKSGLSHEPATRKEMMDRVLGPTYRGKGVQKYVLAKAASRLKDSMGFRVKTVAANKPYYVKDTYYIINALVSFWHFSGIFGAFCLGAEHPRTCVLKYFVYFLTNEVLAAAKSSLFDGAILPVR